MSEQSHQIPTEKGWPLLGVLPNLFNQDPYEYLKNIMLTKGDFVQLNMGPQPVYLVSNPDYLQRILRDNYQNYRKPTFFYNTARQVTQNGLFVTEGDLWLRQRRMIHPHLHRKQLVNLFSDMMDAITEVLKSWEPLIANGTEFELGERMGEITSNVIMHTMFGKNILTDVEIKEISYSVSRIVKYIGEALYSGMVPPWIPIPGRRQFELDRSATREMINRIITKCRQDKDTSASLIQMLINSVDEETHEHMNEAQLFDEVMTIFVAGYESTALALTWLGVAIQNNPNVLKKLQNEIDQVLGTRTPTFEDVPHLTYTRQVFLEILRMYTIAPFLPRALNEADKLGDYELPANALLLIFYHGVHHNPHVWNNPEVFDPERFSPEGIKNQPPFAYVAFSGGPHKCIGDEFTMLEGCLIMAMIFQKYNLSILPNQIFDARMGASMRPRNGVKAMLSPRT